MNTEQKERWENITNKATLKQLGFNIDQLTTTQIKAIYKEAGETMYKSFPSADSMKPKEYLHFAHFFIWRIYKREGYKI